MKPLDDLPCTIMATIIDKKDTTIGGNLPNLYHTCEERREFVSRVGERCLLIVAWGDDRKARGHVS